MKRGASERYTLEEDQVKALLTESETLSNRLIIELMVFLGMRASEVAHFNSNWVRREEIHIPPEQPCDCVNCQKSSHPGKWKPKTRSGVRVLPIVDAIRNDLFTYINQSPKGFNLTRQAIWWNVKQISRRAGIKQKGLAKDTIYPHALRATAATFLASKGMDAQALAYVLGWSNIAIAQHYITLARAKNLAHQQMRDILK